MFLEIQEMIKRKRPLIVLIACLIVNNFSTAQNILPDTSISKIFLTDVSNSYNFSVAMFEQPPNFSQKDWLKIGAIASGTALLFTIDKNVKNFAHSKKNELNNNIFNFDSFYGNQYTAIFTGGLYGVGLFSNNHKIRELGLYTSEAFIISGLTTFALKVIIGRRRPYAGNDNLFLKPFQLTNNDYQSLPSGHTATAFAVSTVMANYFDNLPWKIFWYGSASMVAFSRIYHNKHWVSDVFLGAVIGYFVGEFVINFNSKNTLRVSNLNLMTVFSINRIGIQLNL